MKRYTLATLVFAALLGLSAQAQIITNYGVGDGTSTNSGAYNAANGYSQENYSGTWDGGSGQSISPGTFVAQTFLTPGLSGTVQLYAYNFQLNIQAPNVANPTFNPTFTAALYAWTPSGTGTGGNTTTGSINLLGGPVAGSSTSFTPVIGGGFSLYGTNAVPAPGFGATLDANTIYALVVQRTDPAPTGSITGSVVQYGFDNGGSSLGGASYVDGGLYSSTLGSSYARFGGAGVNDMAFWVSFTSQSLSPVPEPAVSGMMIGGALVIGFIAIRRLRNKSASLVAPAA